MTSKRAYNSPLRDMAAARTQKLILLWAAELFAARGYGRVTVADVAAAAGVSSKTVFASVGSKTDILNRIVDHAVEESGYREAVARILALTTPDAVLAALAHGTRLGNEGQSTALEAIRKALPVHEEGEALWHRASAAYREALHAVAAHLGALGAVPADLSIEEASDLLWLWFGPNGWHTLVTESGWSWDRAEEALLRTARATFG